MIVQFQIVKIKIIAQIMEIVLMVNVIVMMDGLQKTVHNKLNALINVLNTEHANQTESVIVMMIGLDKIVREKRENVLTIVLNMDNVILQGVNVIVIPVGVLKTVPKKLTLVLMIALNMVNVCLDLFVNVTMVMEEKIALMNHVQIIVHLKENVSMGNVNVMLDGLQKTAQLPGV